MVFENDDIILIMEELKEKADKSISSYTYELNTMRAGRANIHILDSIRVDYYGVESPLNQVANLSIPEARMIVITPWDASLAKKIEKAITDANIGLTPSSDGKNIRLTFPEPTEERRRALVKDVKNGAEKCRVAIRNIRRDAVADVKALEKAKSIPEDLAKDCEGEIDKVIAGKIAEVDKMSAAKEAEIMKV